MKCYVHPRVDAIGVCSVCGRGICRSCAELIGGKLYCKADVEGLVLRGQGRQEPEQPRKRGYAITFASAFACLDGLSGMAAGFILVIVGILSQSQPSPALTASLEPLLKYFSAFSSSPGSLITNLGLLVLLLGAADVGAGYLLWRSSKPAGIATVVISILAVLLVVIYLGPTEIAGDIASLYLATAAVKGSALAVGRRYLK